MGALIRLAITAVAVVGAALTAGAAGAGAAPLKVSAVLDRATVDFADPVTASVTVFLDHAAGAADVHLRENLDPLTQLGPTRVTEATRGGVHTVTYTVRASCLDQRCISTRGTRRITLRPVVVDVASGGKSTALWPELQVRPRVSQADVAQPHPPLRSDISPPAVSYRLGPVALARALDFAAAALAAAAAVLAVWTAAALRSRRRRQAPLTGLERALALARDAEGRPIPDRRRALGLLARLLGPRDRQLAGAADELAWSAPAPTSDALAELVSQVEREVNGA